MEVTGRGGAPGPSLVGFAREAPTILRKENPHSMNDDTPGGGVLPGGPSHKSESNAYAYFETAVGGLRNRNDVVHLNQYVQPSSAFEDCFRSVLRFPSDFRDHVRSTGSVRGYDGSALALVLHFDFDDHEDPSKA